MLFPSYKRPALDRTSAHDLDGPYEARHRPAIHAGTTARARDHTPTTAVYEHQSDVFTRAAGSNEKMALRFAGTWRERRRRCGFRSSCPCAVQMKAKEERRE